MFVLSMILGHASQTGEKAISALKLSRDTCVYYLLKVSPAQSADYKKIIALTTFPLKFYAVYQ